MTLKITGAILLFVSAAVFSAMTLLREKRHIERLSALLRLVEYISSGIEHFGQPLPELLRNADKELLSRCAVSETDEGTLSEPTELDEAERELILSFFAELGKGYKSDEMRICRSCRDALASALEARRLDYPKKRKLILTLCFSAVFAVIVIMI